jgi:DNA-binding cell septation regulator SpoVG
LPLVVKMDNNTNQCKAEGLTITQVRVFPYEGPVAGIKAKASVVLNHCLVLKGLKVMKGQFGHFLSFPTQSPTSPYKAYDTSSLQFRKELQHEVLRAFAGSLCASGSLP